MSGGGGGTALRVILIGDAAAGKHNLIWSYTNGVVDDSVRPHTVAYFAVVWQETCEVEQCCFQRLILLVWVHVMGLAVKFRCSIGTKCQ